MTILGLDVGTHTIGIAKSDALGWTAQGITTIRRTNEEDDIKKIISYINEFDITEVLIGLPLNMNGTRGPSVDMATSFGTALSNAINIKITYRDERYSTMAAERILLEGDVSRKKRKKVIDKMAAVFVLQGYLDYLANNPNSSNN